MARTRRDFIRNGVVAAGIAAASTVDFAAAEEKKKMIGACGLACTTCPLMKKGKCKGCASGKDAGEEMVKAKNCPVLSCAAMKKIDYCGTGCKMFTKCKKMIGRPYAKSYMEMIDKKLGGN